MYEYAEEKRRVGINTNFKVGICNLIGPLYFTFGLLKNSSTVGVGGQRNPYEYTEKAQILVPYD